MKAAMFASVRRGLLMEELARNTGGDAEMRNELFICGVFSLLDRLFQQPLAELLRTIPVPQLVHETLVDGTGPYAPYFNLVKAIEARARDVFTQTGVALASGGFGNAQGPVAQSIEGLRDVIDRCLVAHSAESGHWRVIHSAFDPGESLRLGMETRALFAALGHCRAGGF